MRDLAIEIDRIASEAWQGTAVREALRVLHVRRLRRLAGLSGDEDGTILAPSGSLLNLAYLVRAAATGRSRRERRASASELAEVAHVFGDVGAGLEPGASGRLEALIASALLWSLAGYQANACVLARRVTAETDTNPTETPDESQAIVKLVAALAARDVQGVERLVREILNELPARGDAIALENRGADLGPATVLAAAGLMARAASHAVQYWRTGVPEARRSAGHGMQRAADLLLRGGIVDVWLLAETAGCVMDDAFTSGLWRLLPGRISTWNASWSRFLRGLADEGIVELWPSQEAAVEAGLVNHRPGALVLQMPTSAGKTRMIDLGIMAALSATDNESAAAAVIVPSRALAAEVEAHLSRALLPAGMRVSALFGGLESAAFEFNLVAHSDVIVATAEKMDLLLRQDAAFADRLALVVVDEGHMISEKVRGIRLEFLLSRLRRRRPSIRVLCLSAVLPNIDEVANWLRGDGEGSTKSGQWTPTRPVVGYFSWTGAAVDGQRGTILYPRSGDLNPTSAVGVLQKRRLTKRLYPRNGSETAAELALRFEAFGPVLVSSTTKPWVKGIANSILAALKRRERGGGSGSFATKEADGALAEIAARAETLVGQRHSLADYIRRGFAIHTADVPDELRAVIEKAFRDGLLRVVVATSTLGQGVNFPARTVVVAHVRRGSDAWLSVNDFRNLAGRAGRARFETEGHVVVVAETDARARQLMRRYETSSLEPAKSAVLALIETICAQRFPGRGLEALADAALDAATDAPHLTERLDVLDNQLFAIAAEEMGGDFDEDDLLSFLSATLAAEQLNRRDLELLPLSGYLGRRTQAALQRLPDLAVRRGIYRTGLSIAGCERLLAGIDEMLRTDPAIFTDDSRVVDLGGRLLRLASDTPEVEKSCDEAEVLPLAAAALVADWISGESVDALMAQHGAEMGFNDVLVFSAFLTRVGTRDFPWVLSSTIELANVKLGGWNVPEVIASLPAMSKFGLPSPSACFAASVGVRERRGAITVGAAYDVAKRRPATFPRFLRWARELLPDDLQSLDLGVEDRQRLSLRVAALTAERDLLAALRRGHGSFRAEVRAGLAASAEQRHLGGTLPLPVSLIWDTDDPLDPSGILVTTAEGVLLGNLAREVAFGVAALLGADEQIAASVVEWLDPERSSPAVAIVEIRVGRGVLEE